MAATADTVAVDYRVITDACGLVDRSERGKLALTGSEAKTFLHGQVTNDPVVTPLTATSNAATGGRV